MLKVLVTDPIHRDGLSKLAQFTDVHLVNCPGRKQFLDELVDANVLVCRSSVQVDADALKVAKSLKMVIRAGNGLDNIDVTSAMSRRIEISSIPEPGVNAVAEFVITQLLVLNRRVVDADRQVRNGHWDKAGLCGSEIAGKTLGLVGCGRIGTRVAELARGFEMNVLASVANPNTRKRAHLASRGIRLCPLEELVRHSDAISVQVPGGPTTHNLINEKLLQHVRPGCLVIDVSRGGVVNPRALLNGLETGRLGGVAADVHLEEAGIPLLAQHERAILTPHIGGSTYEAQHRIALEVVDRIRQLSLKEETAVV